MKNDAAASNSTLIDEDLEKKEDDDGNIQQDKKVESGAIFTPFFLIVEILSTLLKSLGKNPTLKLVRQPPSPPQPSATDENRGQCAEVRGETDSCNIRGAPWR